MKLFLDVAATLYEAKSFYDVGKIIMTILQKLSNNQNMHGKIGIYDKEIDEYRIYYNSDDMIESEYGNYGNEIYKIINTPCKYSEIKYFSKIVADSREKLIIQDNHSEEALKIHPAQEQFESHAMMWMPLVYKDDFLGIISLGSIPANSFTDDMVETIEGISKLTSVKVYELFASNSVFKKEEVLRKREIQLSNLISNLPGMVYRCLNDKDWTMQYVSEGCKNVTGYLPEDFINNRISYNELVLPQYQEPLWQKWQEVLSEKKYFEEEYLIYDSELKLKWIWERGRGVFNGKDELLYLEGYIEDITERKQAEEALRDSKAYFETLFEHSPISIWEEDFSQLKIQLDQLRLTGVNDWRAYFDSNPEQIVKCASLVKIVNVNQTSVKFFEVNHKEEIPLKLLTFLGPESLEVFKMELISLAEGETHFECEIPIRTLNGGNKILFLSLTVVPGCEQTLSRVLISFIDVTARKKAEEELIKSESRFRSIINILPVPSALNDEDQRITYLNPAFIQTFGYTQEDIPTLADWWPKAYPDHEYRRWVGEIWQNRLDDSKRTGTTFSPMEVTIRCKNGTNKIVLASAASFIDSYEGNHLVVLYDITERTEAEKALHESEKRYENFISQSSEGIYRIEIIPPVSIDLLKPEIIEWINKHAIVADLNESLAMMYGFVREEMIGRYAVEFAPDYGRRAILVLESVDLKVHQTETTDIDKTGNPLFLEESFSGEVNDGRLTRIWGVQRNITERKRIDAALRESEKKYRTLIEQTTDGVLMIDSIGNYVDVNMGVCQMLGYSKEEILSMNMKQLVPEEDLLKQAETVERMLKGENVLTQRRFKCKNGTYIETELNARMLPDGRFCAFVRDISERKKAEAEHLRLQNLESLGVLAGGIAHDFNNILAVILGRASIAQVHASDKRVKSDLESIEKASKRAVGLTQQLLTFAKGGTPEKCIIDIKRIIQDTAQFSLSGSNVTTEFSFSDSLTLNADPGQISQVIQNLVINAKQAMPNGGVINISTMNFIDDKERQFIKIVIKDRGTGISKENLNKIFDPYFTTKDTGTGLGLSVCHSIIKRHEGYLSVESEINVGSYFTILLPATRNEIQSNNKTNSIIDSKLNILIMDDEETIRELLSSLLIECGHKVSATKEGEEAIRMYKQAKDDGTPYDIVFLDLTIKGGMGGKETVKKIREYDPEAKVAVSSGYANTSVSSYQEDGFDGMLKKPYTIEELNQVIFEVTNK